MENMSEPRKIIHVDMDAFYASVEQRDHPEWKGLPVVVGGERDRGVVAAASYEARKFGVHSAMSSKLARKKCPDLIFCSADFRKYKQISREIRAIFLEYTDLVEPLSLDEAFLDVTMPKKGPNSATLIAKEIKQRIKDQLSLTASAGVSYNKFLAKIASDVKKPDGLFVIRPDQAHNFIDTLEIDRFYGVGKVTAKKMNEMGIYRGADLRLRSLNDLVREFGKAGRFYYDVVRGIDNRPVTPDRERKSVGVENTFARDLSAENDLVEQIHILAKELWKRTERAGKIGKTLTLKVKFSDFEQITRSVTRQNYFLQPEDVLANALPLLKAEWPFPLPVRLLGLSLSNFYIENSGPVQLRLDFV